MDQSLQEAASVPMAADEIEIPEPDYDDDDDKCASPDNSDVTTSGVSDDVTAGCCHDNDEASSPQPAAAAVNDNGSCCDTNDQSDNDDKDDSRTYSFDEVRAKLEAFSRDELCVLAASIARDIGPEIPEPDYSDSDDELSAAKNADDVAISPKKLDSASAAATKEHKQLLRELLHNQKLGVNVLSKKSELDREMEKRKLRQQRREDDEKQRMNRSAFDKLLEQQANKLTLAVQQEATERDLVAAVDVDSRPEFIKVHSKINSKLKSAS